MEAPVFYCPELGVWSVARQADVLAVLKDTKRFSNRSAIPVPIPPEQVRARMPLYPSAQTVLFLDDPDHRPARAEIQAPFTPRSLKVREERMRAHAETLLAAGAQRGRIEFVHEYGMPLALGVIGDIAGVPPSAHALLERAVTAVFRLNGGGLKDEDAILEAANLVADYYEYLRGVVEERLAVPRDDYTSVMIHARAADEDLPGAIHDVAVHLHTLLAAGFETSAQLMTHGVAAILRDPAQWAALRRDRSLLESAVTEMLRHRTVVKRIFRVATEDVVIGGVEIPEGSVVALLLASANHDEDVYDDPAAFDIHRKGDNLAFGRWKHFCVGAPLARLELKVTLETLLDHYPQARLVEDQELQWRSDTRIDALLSLELELTPVLTS
jgi:cytochrome P450